MSTAPPQPPTADKTPYTHFAYVKDATTVQGGVVDDRTPLAGVYRFDNSCLDNRFLRNITGICDIKVRCQILTDCPVGSVALPPTLEQGKHGFDTFVTFNHLVGYLRDCGTYHINEFQLMAPSLRIEIHFFNRHEPGTAPYHKLALELPFNSRSGKQLHDFEYRGGDDAGPAHIRLSSTGATYEGVTLLHRVQERFGQDEKDAVTMLQSLARRSPKKQLHFVLQCQEMSLTDRADFQKIIARLPGGHAGLFSSIGVPEFSNYPLDEKGNMLLPKALMTLATPNPMVPLDCPYTFGSFAHLRADQLGFASMSQWENETALRLFAMCPHRVAVYALNGTPIIAMKFGAPPENALTTAGGMRLPNELEIRVTLNIPGVGIKEYTAVRDPYLQGLPPHDAYFMVTSHDLHQFNGRYSIHDDYKDSEDKDKAIDGSDQDTDSSDDSNAGREDDKPQYMPILSLSPHPTNFLLRSLTSAINSLSSPKHDRFLQIALGQEFKSIKQIDVTAGLNVRGPMAQEAIKRLRNKKWNTEQRQVVDQMTCAKGGISLVTGTAGTGKTTAQMAMAVAFCEMGGRAACFATSNSNVLTQAETVSELAKATKGSVIRVVRIVSTSRGIGFKYLTATQALSIRVGHNRGTVSTIWGLQFVRHDQRVGKMNDDWKYTVEACKYIERQNACKLQTLVDSTNASLIRHAGRV